MCGAPATTENGQTLCWGHRLHQDQAALPEDIDLAEAGRWRQQHRVRPGAIPSKRYIPGEELGVPNWRGCRVEILAFTLGEEGSGADTSGADTSRVLVGYPWHFERFPKMGGPCTIVRWRLYHPGKPGYLEVTWDGARKRGERLRRSVVVHNRDATPDDAARLASLWTEDTERALPPRKPGPKPRPRSELVDALTTAAVAAGAPALTPQWSEIYARMVGAADSIYRSRTVRLEERGEKRIEIEEVMDRARVLKEEENSS